jgi:hypothetical protein
VILSIDGHPPMAPMAQFSGSGFGNVGSYSKMGTCALCAWGAGADPAEVSHIAAPAITVPAHATRCSIVPSVAPAAGDSTRIR